MNEKEFEEFIKRNPSEAARLISKAFKPEELLKVGNRSYSDAYKYPESRFDPGDLGENRFDFGDGPPDMLQPHVDPLKLLTDKYMIPPSQMIFKSGGLTYRKEEWGQIAGGITEPATVTNAAIQALPVTGGQVFMKRGFYLMNTKTVIDRAVHLIGEGAGIWTAGTENITYLQLAEDVNDHLIEVDPDHRITTVRIAHMTLNGDSGHQTAGHLINVDDALGASITADIYFDHLIVYNAKEAGLRISGSWNYWITNNMFEYNQIIGIDLIVGYQFYLAHNFVLGNGGFAGILIRHGVRSVEIIGGVIRNNEQYGLALGGANHLTVSDVKLLDNGTNAVNTYDGIIIYRSIGDDPFDITVIGCISKNRATANQRYGINLFDYGDWITLLGNDVRNNVTAGIGIALGVNPNGIMKDNMGHNPVGVIATPFDAANSYLAENGTAAVPAASTDYTVIHNDMKISSSNSGNANCAIMLKDQNGVNVLLAALGTIQEMYVPRGFILNWGAFTGAAPTVIAAFG